MLVEGPPGPEGPAVSGTFPLLRVWDAVPGLCCSHLPQVCTEGALGWILWCKNKQRAPDLLLLAVEICYK